ncbi:MAG: M14 family zinc carboxypeptidase [Planctomycetota bacterium]
MNRSTRIVQLAAIAVVAAGSIARAQITLSANFDHASLDLSGSSVNGGLIQLAGRDNFNPGQWKWVYFAADGVIGQQPVFRIDDNFVTGGSNLDTHAMVYSYDNEQWSFFDNNNRNASADTFTFSNDTPFTEDRVFVAYALPYPFARARDHTASLISSPWVSPTASGNSQLVIGKSPGGIDELFRSIPPLDLYGYRVTDPSATGPKAKVVLAGGIHANETLGNYTLEALVDFLVSDTLEAGLLRRSAEFYVYPMINPDGRLAGYNRGTVEDEFRDPNRSWDPPGYDGQPEVATVGEAMRLDTGVTSGGGGVDYFIDFHSTVQKGPGHFAFIDLDRDFQLDPFWQSLLQLEPTIGESDASLISDTAARFGLFDLGADFTITFETRFIAGENADRFDALGENFGLALAETLNADFGDLNTDGQIDVADYTLLVAGSEASTAGLTPLEAYMAGDLNSDGVNDGLDFGLFKDAFIAANGAPAFARLVAGVPEPGALAVLLAASPWALLRFRSSFCSRREGPRSGTTGVRLRRRALMVVATLAMFACGAGHARAVVFEEFLFNDTAGTPVQSVASNVNPGSFFTADEDSSSVVTNGLGQLDLGPKNNGNRGQHFADIEPGVTTGTVFGVMELTWDFQSPLDTSNNEELRITLINNAPTGIEVTAEFRLVRNDSNQMVITGRAFGSGATAISDSPLIGSGLTQTDKFIAVVAADLDNDTYELLYSADAGANFVSGGVGVIDSTRVVESFRMEFNNDFVGDNVLIDRVYVADELSIVPDINTLTLQVNTISGAVSIVNDTAASAFDIDYYRVTSGDDSLVLAEWDSLQDQNFDAVDGPDQGAESGDGTGEVWTEAGAAGPGVLSETFLLSSSEFTTSAPPVFLGQVFDTAGDPSQLSFEFRDATTGGLFVGEVQLINTLEGDYNGDLSVDTADYTTWRDGFGTTFDEVDYLRWKANFGASQAGAAVVPEPTTGAAAVLAFGLLAFRRQR